MNAHQTPQAVIADASGALSRLGCADMAADLARAGENFAELVAAMKFLLPRIHQTNGADCVDRAKAALVPFDIKPPHVSQASEHPLANKTIYTKTKSGLSVAVAFDVAGKPKSVARKSARSGDYNMFWEVGSGSPMGNSVKSAILAAIHEASSK
jgi:hypothetical protein